ncbi:GNAT family N-acetyltransferase [Saccharibacillus qingshengii]|uniref:GNAT family N-acetyltransferase n=1 Tax=Saccharibacillus qingshengii TaxID=1763540 RepID=UPI0015571E7B|nr:GNAT family N-acetyltransferase [Saccharibacillus qingshengii]
MTIELRTVDSRSRDAIQRIYEDSFPEEEMIAYETLIEISSSPDHLFYGLYDGDSLVGMTYLITTGSMLYVLYLAIRQNHQSQGYGKKVIREIVRRYPDYRICLNIEEVEAKYENYQQRIKRKEFYRSLGFEDQGYRIDNAKGYTFETLVVNGSASY